jgi:bifunctional DNA-binding transcriptional regulator/antitoxin component of YhaV-PrlF toxin-antitoxin module
MELEAQMPKLTVTSRGQITLRKEYLEHIGVGPGEKIFLDKTANGKLTLERPKPKGSWDDFFGCLAGQTNVRLTVEEINEAIGDAIVAEYERGVKR